MTAYVGAPESDVVLSFQQILTSALGQQEAQLAQQLESVEYARPRLLVVDTTSSDMRVGDRATKRRRLVYASATAAEPAGSAVKHSPAGGASRELPPGWKVDVKVHRQGPNTGKRYKVYVAPDGKRLLSYVTAIAYHDSKQGQRRSQQSAERQADEPPASLPPGWTTAQVKGEDGRARTEYISPTGERFVKWAQAARALRGSGKSRGAGRAPHVVNVTMQEVLDWLRQLAREPEDAPEPSADVQQALLRTRQALSSLKKSRRLGVVGAPAGKMTAGEAAELLAGLHADGV